MKRFLLVSVVFIVAIFFTKRVDIQLFLEPPATEISEESRSSNDSSAFDLDLTHSIDFNIAVDFVRTWVVQDVLLMSCLQPLTVSRGPPS